MLRLATGMKNPLIMANSNYPLGRPSLHEKRLGLNHHGFSLIEIMVVMVIVGIILSFVVVAFGDFGASRRVDATTKHLASLIQLAQTKAIIGNKTYGLSITPKTYQFFQFQPNPKTSKSEWYPVKHTHVFQATRFPTRTKVSLTGAIHHQGPQIIINSHGQITPFTLTLTLNHDSYHLKSVGNGDLHIGDL